MIKKTLASLFLFLSTMLEAYDISTSIEHMQIYVSRCVPTDIIHLHLTNNGTNTVTVGDYSTISESFSGYQEGEKVNDSELVRTLRKKSRAVSQIELDPLETIIFQFSIEHLFANIHQEKDLRIQFESWSKAAIDITPVNHNDYRHRPFCLVTQENEDELRAISELYEQSHNK